MTATAEPTTVIAGDTCEWVKTLPDYPASAGWSLLYLFLPLSNAGQPFNLTSTASGDDHKIRAEATDTTAWVADTYRYQLKVKSSTEQFTLAVGTLEVQSAFGATGLVPLTHNEKCLFALTAVLEGDLDNPLSEYKIEGREAKRWPRLDLVRLRSHYQRLVGQERGQGLGVSVIRVGLARTPGV